MKKTWVLAGLGVTILVAGVLFASGVFKGQGMVKIVTDPGDAQIFINGERKGNSPAAAGQTFAIKLKEGEYTIEALIPVSEEEEKYGVKKDVFVAKDSMQTVSIELEKRETEAGRIARIERERKVELARKEAIETYLKEYPKFKMVDIPAGKFRMGCSPGDTGCDSDEKPAHWVTLSAFKMSATEVTFDEWDAYVKAGGSDYRPDDEGWGRGTHPVINVSWDHARNYVAWLNKATGKHYALPTEAQWEYAARAGTTTAWSFGNDAKQLGAFGWHDGNSNRKTHVVGTRKPNPWGLYDMHGNVYEWCQDRFGDYPSGSVTDPEGPSSGSDRVLRGGSWFYSPRLCRSSYRNHYGPDGRCVYDGFRLVLLPGQ